MNKVAPVDSAMPLNPNFSLWANLSIPELFAEIERHFELFRVEECTQELANLATEFGRALKLSSASQEALYAAAYLHDVGKLRIPHHVLHHPGRLNSYQWIIMRSHASLSYQVAKQIPQFGAEVESIVLHHHERFNGSGYPGKLKGGNIPYLVRVFSLCDVWLALVSKRCYKPAYSPDSARLILEDETERGLHDPVLVRSFIEFLQQSGRLEA